MMNPTQSPMQDLNQDLGGPQAQPAHHLYQGGPDETERAHIKRLQGEMWELNPQDPNYATLMSRKTAEINGHISNIQVMDQQHLGIMREDAAADRMRSELEGDQQGMTGGPGSFESGQLGEGMGGHQTNTGDLNQMQQQRANRPPRPEAPFQPNRR